MLKRKNNMFDINTLDPMDQKVLKDIFAKENIALTRNDKEILRARRDYLTAEQLERYGKYLEVKEKKAKVEDKKTE
jgi:hypothetical protein